MPQEVSVPPQTPNRFEQHKKLTLLIFFLLVLALADFAAARLFLPRTAMRPNPYSHHDLARNYRGTEFWGVTYPFFTNNLGFSDSKVRTVPLVPKGRRIIFIGDSFTEGLGVPWAQTFVGRIAETLEPKGIEVLNAATASYSPLLYYDKMKYWIEQGLAFSELVVFMDISDVRDELAYRDFVPGSPYAPKFLLRQANSFLNKNSFLYASGLYWRARELLLGKSMATEARDLHDAERVQWTLDEGAYAAWGEEGVVLGLKNMDALYELLNARNVKLSIAVYPWRENIAARDMNSKQVTIWQNFAKERGLAFYNFFPPFMATSTPPEEVIARYFIPGDYHWTADGHEFIAREWLAQYLKETK